MPRNPQRFRGRTSYSENPIEHRVVIKYYDNSDILSVDDVLDYSYTDGYSPRAQYCSDTVGYPDRDNPLYLETTYLTPCTINVRYTNHVVPDYGGRWERTGEYSGTYSFINDVIFPGDDPADDIAFITEAASRSNPSKANVQGAAFMAELRSLPSLFESTGSNMAKFGANEYLKFQYGWTPFVKDLRKMFNVISRIRSRLNNLERLRKGGVLRTNYNPPPPGNRKFRSEVSIPDPYRVIYLDGATIGFTHSTECTEERWADVVWVADPPKAIGILSASSEFETARNAVYGLNIDGPTLWELMPWSWMIDWVHNVDDYISSQNNTVGAKFGNAVLMRRSKLITRTTPSFYEQGEFFHATNTIFTDGVKSSVFKERLLDIEPGIVQTGEFASILGDEFKLSILGALGIQRLRR